MLEILNDGTLIQEFAVEGKTHVEKIEATLLEMEQGEGDSALINVLFRSAHSIKGTAGFFGLHKIVTLSHSMENLLGKVRNNEIKINSIIIDALLMANDRLGEMLGNIAESENIDITSDVKQLTELSSANEGIDQNKQLVAQMHSLKVTVKDSLQVKIGRSNNSETYKKQVIDLLKRGHKLYQLILNVDHSEIETNRKNFFQGIASIGTVISCYRDRRTVQSQLVFLFSTVLAKELVLMSLDIAETNLFQLNDDIEEKELFKILSDGEQGESSQEEELLVPKEELILPGSEKKQKHHDKEEESIRVSVALLNKLVHLSGEMVLSRNRLVRIIDQHEGEIVGIDSVLQNIDAVTTELQEKIMRTRMQTLANLFNAMPRIVRELAKTMGKSINLRIEGKAVEMDKSVIEGLSDPLTHLLRNALDHGIETSVIRSKAGKPPIAEVMIKAYHEGGHVVIDIIDDGAGIDLSKIKAKALERGLLTVEQISYMSEHELRNMIFLPGFSTAEGVTDISGRGVGLDVAKSNIEKLGGTIEVYTVLGKGTTFRLILPLTLAIIPSLIVSVAEQNFVLPQVHVQEIVRIVPGQLRKIEMIQGHQVLRLRDKLVPVIHLADIFALPIEERLNHKITRVLILKNNGKVFGLLVDEIHEQEEILVKPLPRYLKGTKGYSGLTILGDGKVAMVLDIENIGTIAKLVLAEEHIQGMTTKNGMDYRSVREPQRLLLFTCSGSEIFGLHLAMIARVDELDVQKIQRVGNREYMDFRGQALRLIRLSDHLPISKAQTEGKKVYVIIPKMVKNPMGIIVEKIQDTVDVELEVDRKQFKEKGIFGSVILNESLVLLLNLYELFDVVESESLDGITQREVSGQGRTVLVIEDTPFYAEMEKQYLEQAGYRVIIATNGKDGLGIVRKHKIDIVLIDMNLPVMDGTTLMKTMRSDEQLSLLPIIGLTPSMVKQEQEKLILETGFDAYECKFNRDHLLEKIMNLQGLKGGKTH
ncbi:chemotaxis protein CheW [Pelosinus sp. sgz500959]|uniref:hybrid sensor histidine kinase/response regulator n=1 Tax=Pelosinus sp. sgz500959 TaxID=3242472 RepID=UPI00366D2834